ncbi:MAG: peptidylprolyl isomerase [Deltaproteobacteria bacterium]|nr:peptidylprolyl isomerase [Deltaproteobacteria bacterium]
MRKLSTFVLGLLAIAAPMAANASVLAKVGDKPITDEMVRSEYETITGDQRKAVNDDAATRRNMIENAINAELLVQAAKKSGLEKDEEYQRAVEHFQRQYLASRFMQKAVEPKLSKGEVKKFFEANKHFFDTTQVCAYHIVVQEEKDAEKILAQTKVKGAKFEEIAKKNSLDPSVQENKGNLGCFTRDRMVPEFAAAAFNMRKGETKGPVHTMYGYHVIKVYDIKAGKVPGYDEVEQQAKESLRTKLVSELINDLRAKSSVKVDESEAKAFKL